VRTRSIKTFAVGALAALTGATAAFGQGGTRTIASEIVIRDKFPAFHGRVKAENDACVESREVKLFKERRNGSKKLLGKTASDPEGKWEVIVDPLKSGAYFAVVRRREEGTAGTTFVCERDKSPVVTVD
jgi:hypothetical protein